MESNPDPLLPGVRWAVRILRLFGGLMLVPACIFAPLVFLICLAYGLSGRLNAWQVDGICLLASFPLILGKSVVVAAECLERSHSLGRGRFDPANEWKKVVDITLHGVSLIAYIGAVICIVELAFGKLMKPPVAGNWVFLVLHLTVAVASYLAPDRLTMGWLKEKIHSD